MSPMVPGSVLLRQATHEVLPIGKGDWFGKEMISTQQTIRERQATKEKPGPRKESYGEARK